MQKFSGLILDVYDDPSLTLFKKEASLVEEAIKTAHLITQEEREKLADESFALVLEQNGHELKKFATIDPSNTALSVAYFLKTAHKLPEQAQKIAARNLMASCEAFDLPYPKELMKIAFQKILEDMAGSKGVQSAVGMGSNTMTGLGAVGKMNSNIKAVKGAGQDIMTPHQMGAL